MKWINGETWKHKLARLSEWHSWFAWYPIKIRATEDGHWIKIWGETILRKGSYVVGDDMDTWWNWEYKEIEN